MLVGLFVGLLILIFLSSLLPSETKQAYRYNPDETVISAEEYFSKFPNALKSASVVELGLYLDSLYDLDLSKLTFKARGWLWYNWSKTPMIEGRIDPGQMGQFDLNFLDETEVNQELSSQRPVIDVLASGLKTYWNETSFDAKLAAPSIDLKNYPFDSQILKVLVTNPVHETGELIYKIEQFRLPPSLFNIIGYRLDGINYSEQVRVYSSNFSDSSDVNWRDASATTQSQASFAIYISRDPMTSLLEYVMPLAIVSFLGVCVVRLDVRYWEVKITAPPAAVLSLIFLQNSFQQDIPRVSYMTCMDMLFFLGYLVCLLSFTDGLLHCLKVQARPYRGIYGYFACSILAISPALTMIWLRL